METLTKKKIPLLQEFNPYTYTEKNMLETYCYNISNVYNYFLDVNDYLAGKEKIMAVSRIYDFAVGMLRGKEKLTDMFFF